VAMPAGSVFGMEVERSRKVFAFVFEGDGSFDPEDRRLAGVAECVLFDRGEEIKCKAGLSGMRFILVSGTPLHEDVAWRGPIVMNTNEELDTAFGELANGTFIRKTSKK
jgi:quercetin 2,3-dioxygenase